MKEGSDIQRFYFWDYLWWLGEKTQEHYQGAPRRPDGGSIVMMYISFFLIVPLIFSFIWGGLNYWWILGPYIVFVFLWDPWLQQKIWDHRRRTAVMHHYRNHKFSPLGAYTAMFFPVALFFFVMMLQANVIEENYRMQQRSTANNKEVIHQIINESRNDSSRMHRPLGRPTGRLPQRETDNEDLPL